MSFKDKFSKVGEKLGQTLDDASKKVQESNIKDYGKKIVDKATEIGGNVVNNVAEKLDETPTEEKFCISCGNKITSKRTKMIADGELCKACAYKYDEFANKKNISIANMTLKELDESYNAYKKKEKKITLWVCGGVGLLVILIIGGLLIGNKGKKEEPKKEEQVVEKTEEQKTTEEKNELSVEKIESISIGKNVDEVVAELNKLGYTNIEKIGLEDITENEKEKENLVAMIVYEEDKTSKDIIKLSDAIFIGYHSIGNGETKETEKTKESSDVSSLDDVVDILNANYLSGAKDEMAFMASRLGGTLYVDLYLENAKAISINAKNGDAECLSAWTQILDILLQQEETVKAILEQYGMGEYTVVVRLVDDTKPTDYLAKIRDGKVKDDVVHD